jgi:hypothetical protein
MKRRTPIVTAFSILGLLLFARVLSADHPGTASQNEFRWQGDIAAGKALEIKGVNGNVRAEASSDGQVQVTATKHGRRQDPKSVEIRVVEHDNGVTICAVYPSDSSRPNECVPGEGGRMNVRNNDVSVDFSVRIPAGVRFVGRTVNGQVEATELGAEVEAHTVNGNIRLATSGYAHGKTVNGSISASLGSFDWTQPVEFETVNGSITLDLPAAASALFEAETVNGNISTDFPLTVQGKLNRHHVSGTIGGGGRQLLLKTVNGSIELRRGH